MDQKQQSVTKSDTPKHQIVTENDVSDIKNDITDINTKSASGSVVKKSKKKTEQERDRKPVKGMFKFYEVPKGTLKFFYRKYKGERVGHYELTDGQVYTLPLGVAKHLNTSGWYPVHRYAQDEEGNKNVRIGEKVRRYGFQSLEFMPETEEGKPGIVTVEKI